MELRILSTHPLFETVVETGIATPGDSLAVGQPAGALGLEVEEALRKGFSVVKGGPAAV